MVQLSLVLSICLGWASAQIYYNTTFVNASADEEICVEISHDKVICLAYFDDCLFFLCKQDDIDELLQKIKNEGKATHKKALNWVGTYAKATRGKGLDFGQANIPMTQTALLVALALPYECVTALSISEVNFRKNRPASPWAQNTWP
eukprot:4077176-Ditylum_brightwellii.AAC.2